MRKSYRHILLPSIVSAIAGIAIWKACTAGIFHGSGRLRVAIRIIREDLRQYLRRYWLRVADEGRKSPKLSLGLTTQGKVLASTQVTPLDTIDDLLQWTIPREPYQHLCCTYNAPLRIHAHEAIEARPRLLVCHDMANGYHDDSYIQGTSNAGYYRMSSWASVDMFVYFSHHMITIPPPGWISAAHKNGVKVLGTFITEWGPGRRACERMLASRSISNKVADQLVDLALFHGFEGWLLNIENTLPTSLVPAMLHFISYLRAAMQQAVGSHALVIWYDAVTTEGWLEWQNNLTPLNLPFFDATDALFVNYAWNDKTPAQAALAAGAARRTSVFLGTDIWGRGTFGGGKENCSGALTACQAEGLSAALFAPAWVYEAFPSKEDFPQRQVAFWNKIESCWPVRSAASRQLSALPIHSSFCTGTGAAGMWLRGCQVSTAPWFNMSLQDIMPACKDLGTWATTALQGGAGIDTAESSSAGLSLEECATDAFQGGSCLVVKGVMEPSHLGHFPLKQPFCSYKHVLDLSVQIPTTGLIFKFAIKSVKRGSHIALVLLLANSKASASVPHHESKSLSHMRTLPELSTSATSAAATTTSSAEGAMAISGLPTDGCGVLLLVPEAQAIVSDDGQHSAPESESLDALRSIKVPFIVAKKVDGDSYTKPPTLTASAAGCTGSGNGSGVWELWRATVDPAGLHTGGLLASEGIQVIGLGVVCWLSRQKRDEYCSLLGHVSVSSPEVAMRGRSTAGCTSQTDKLGVSVHNLAWQEALQASEAARLRSGVPCCALDKDVKPEFPSPPAGAFQDVDVEKGPDCDTALLQGDGLILSCDLVWVPQFDSLGLPVHTGYHVWSQLEMKQHSVLAEVQPDPAPREGSSADISILSLQTEATSDLQAAASSALSILGFSSKSSGPSISGTAEAVQASAVQHVAAAVALEERKSSSEESIGWENVSPSGMSPTANNNWVLTSPSTAVDKVASEARSTAAATLQTPSPAAGVATPQSYEMSSSTTASRNLDNGRTEAAATGAQTNRSTSSQQQCAMESAASAGTAAKTYLHSDISDSSVMNVVHQDPRYLGHALAAGWSVQGFKVPSEDCVAVRFGIQAVWAKDGLVQGSCSDWVSIRVPVNHHAVIGCPSEYL
ncbi:hypothetical protein CEUSTIGMA_g5388.t1 [Chlamydomonas eustigma]|uniref:Cytosolic endo-beta-N-acetylglucosaminidase TIM barrel domain-containing protein n=1 Tax=Chlamydomonas eustigma TaxID=1157962 RepID=A0A250X4G3_9CHLO|nr:hypothetical protein CEUSTIGMA_g5388.t1 [Chlamydomonas eustigma]|eukprot:GAX77946.1 hypothetical protein CEUSTIGMA_g5388.t1 [Chlamydomonas eustigma]